MDMSIHDDDVVIIYVNYDDDMLLYEHELYRWIISMFLWDDSSGGELLSLGQFIFVYYWEGALNIRLLLHWRVVTCIHFIVVVDERCKL